MPVQEKQPKIIKPGTVLGEDNTRLFERVAQEVLHEDRILFDTLTEHEKQIVLKWMQEAVVEGEAENNVHDILWEIDYARKPIGIETFIMEDEYFGRVCKDLHEKWIDDLKAVFAPGSKIFEWIMTGAIGIGKTTLAMTALGYKIYLMSCLRDPAGYYGLLTDSLIIFGIYSITKRQVADTGYYKLRGWLDASPYFRYQFPRSKKIDSKIDFKPSAGKSIQVIPGSQELHALGLDLFAFAMDEVNFMREKRDKDKGKIVGQAYDLYNATHTRLKSRFIRPGGTLPGIMLLMSSRNAQTSFLEGRLKVVNRETTYVSDYALWDVKPKHKFTMPTFSVEVGDRVAQSRVLREEDEPRKGSTIIKSIPGEFLDDFLQDVDQALRDIAGVATFNISPLIRDRESIFDAVRAEMSHPFTKKEVMLDHTDDVMLDEFFLLKSVCHVVNSSWTPRVNPHYPRFIHLDLSLSGDCAGMAMGHVSGKVRREKFNLDGTVSVAESPFIIIDFMIRITPPPFPGQVDLSKLRAFILYLSKLFPIAKVTADGYQSADTIQLLQKAGFEAKVQSIDKTDAPYLSLRAAHFERRIGVYDYTPYIDEVLDLQRDAKTRKVDHPERSTRGGRGSKDVADAVAGVVWQCVTDERAGKGTPLFTGATSRSSVVDPSKPRPKPEHESRMAAPKRVGGRTVDWEKLRNR
jgi:hypothetical protein